MARSKPDEIDLHGLNIEQALTRFSGAYNLAAKRGGRARLVVIHGWNASDPKGSIAAALHRRLKQRGIEFEHPFEGNQGRTRVVAGAAWHEAGHRGAGEKPIGKRPENLRGGL